MVKILIVDDETSLLKLLKKALESQGFSVETAESGETALSKICSFIPELIILDVNLGPMNGFDILKQLKTNASYRDIPVFILTGRSDDEDVKQGIENYADKYFIKPIEITELVQEVRSTMKWSRSHG